MPIDREVKRKPTTWQGYIEKVVPLPFPIPWLIVGLLIFCLVEIGAWLVHTPYKCIPMFAISAFLIAGAANAVIFYARQMEHFFTELSKFAEVSPEKLDKWYLHRFIRVFSVIPNLGSGIILGVCIVVVTLQAGAVIPGFIGKIIHGGVLFLIGLAGGSMLWVLLGVAWMISDIGRGLEIKIPIFQSKTGGIRSVSHLILRVSIVAICVYLLGISLLPFIPHQKGLLQLTVAFGFGVFVIGYFVLSQWNISRAIQMAKEKRISKLLPSVEKAFERVTNDPSAENLRNLRELFDLQKTINNTSSWSFGIREMLILLGSVIIPLLVALIQLFPTLKGH